LKIKALKIATNTVRGRTDALTDRQEIIDLTEGIFSLAIKYSEQKIKALHCNCNKPDEVYYCRVQSMYVCEACGKQNIDRIS